MRNMRRAGARRSVAVFCIAVVLVAALMPGFAALDYAIPEPAWVLLPEGAAPAASLPSRTFAGVTTQVIPPLPGRAPPLPSLPS